MKTEDKIGEMIQKLVTVEADITQLAFMEQGAQHPEMIGQYHQQLHEKRALRTTLRAELLVLKQMHRTELKERMKAIELEMEDDTNDHWDIEELKGVQRAVERKLAIVEEEIEKLSV